MATGLNDTCYVYKFIHDNRKLLIRKEIPGAGTIHLRYDRQRRLIEEEDDQGNISYIDYDKFSRPIRTGIIRESKKFALTETFYDFHHFAFAKENPYTLSPEKKSINDKLRITGSRMRILGSDTSKWIENATYYDNKGRILQTFSSNNYGGVDEQFFNYDFVGNITSEYLFKNIQINGKKQRHIIFRQYDYKNSQWLTSIKYKLNRQPRIELIKYQYNDKGNIINTQYHNGQIQQNYQFDFHNRLTQIKTLNTRKDTLFRQTLGYQKLVGKMTTTAQYNGNISAIQWKTLNTPLSGYAFEYDPTGQLIQAQYYCQDSLTNQYTTLYTYNPHGNITSLQRKGDTPNNKNQLINNLEYQYKGNQLTQLHRNSIKQVNVFPGDLNNDGTVEPADLNTMGIHRNKKERKRTQQGNNFKAHKNYTHHPELSYADANGDGIINEKDTLAISQNHTKTHSPDTPKNVIGTYTYDTLGNMTYDSFKKLKIHYNDINLPDTLIVADRGRLINTYLADGTLIRRKIRNHNDSLLLKIDYQGEFLFINDTLQHIQNEAGYYTEQNGFHYLINDHLGNPRVIANSQGKAIRENTYYPYGAKIDKLTIENDHKYNKNHHLYTQKEYLDHFGINWYDFHARQYDAQLGRWFAIDPALQMHSPYMAMGNNPVAFIDPDGEWAGWDDLIAGIVGGVINVAANWNNIDNIWEGIATFGVGAGLGVAGLYTAGSTWAKLGVVAGSGIVAGATNNMIAQLDHNTNFSQLNYRIFKM